MKFKKLVVSLIICALLLSVAGCAKSNQTSDTSTKAETVSATTAEQKSSLKGPGQEEPLEFSIMFDAIMWTKNNKDINGSEELKAWSERSNTKITFITPPSANYNEKLNIMTAGGDLPDVIETINSNQLASLLEAESIIPMDELFEKYGTKFASENKDKGWNRCKIGGVTYAIPVYTTFYSQQGFIARKDWLDKLNLALPKTLDEYVNVLKAFTLNDPDQNGKNDTYGISFRQNFVQAAGFLRSFGIDSNTIITYDYVDGKLVPQQTQEKYKKYLAFERQLWKDGIYTPNSMINTSDQWKKEIFTGIAGMWYHQTYRIDEYFMKQFKSTQGEGTAVELTALEPPTGYNGEKSSVMTDPVYMALSINKDSKEAESIFNYYMWVFTDSDVREYAKWGIEGIHHTVKDGAKTWIPEAMSNDVYNQWKELVFITSNYPVDNDEVAIRYGERGIQNHELNLKYAKPNAVQFVGKPALESEKDHPDIDKIVLEYSTKIISGELELEAGFNEMLKRLNDAGLEAVTAARQEWYNKNK